MADSGKLNKLYHDSLKHIHMDIQDGQDNENAE
jgi:hypothetical protein